MNKGLEYTFDQELKEVPLDKEVMLSKVEEMISLYNENFDYNLASSIGSYLRILRDFDRALYYSESAYRHNKKTSKEHIRDSIRLATLYQWLHRFEESNRIYSNLAKLELGVYEDFFYQHLGKNLLEQGKYLEAKKAFGKALNIRLNKGDSSLILSTQGALNKVEELLLNT